MYEMVLTVTSLRASASSRQNNLDRIKRFMSAPYFVTSFIRHLNMLTADLARSNVAEAETGLENRSFTSGLSGGKKMAFWFQNICPRYRKRLVNEQSQFPQCL